MRTAGLPAYVYDRPDFTSLTQLPDAYVSDELQKTFSDIVYSCERKDGKGDVRTSLLLEHKSAPYQYTLLQMGGDLFSGYLRQVTNKEPLSLIIPVLLYHGRKRREYRTLTNLFQGLYPEWNGLTELHLENRLIVYIPGCSGLGDEQIVAILEALPAVIKDKVMSTLDIFIEKGGRQGCLKNSTKGIFLLHNP